MPLTAPHSNQGRLDSWKEIAAYLERDVRTARRWEKERGLPVHRVPGGERGAVFAYRPELDAWLQGGADNDATSENEEARGVGSATLPATSGHKGIHEVSSPAIDITSQPNMPGRWRSLLLVLLCGLAVSGYLLWQHSYGGPVTQASFSSNSLVARNKKGSVLWRYDFGQPLDPNPENPAERITIADLGLGRNGEVLAAVPFASPDRGGSSSDELYCFSARGRVRWHHLFDDVPRFGGHDYGPPWIVSSAVVMPNRAESSIWVAAREAFWSPAVLVKLDRDGHQLAKFVNWGHIAVVSRLRNSSGSYILVGGISNQCDCAMLAVLREGEVSGNSPPREPAFTCENCPEGRPYRYILFPRSELTLLSGAAYDVLRLIHAEDGHVWVGVSETRTAESPGPDWIKYNLSESFVPQTFTVSDHFWTFHRQMEVEGKLHHTTAQCPERTQPRKVQVWSPEGGWEQVTVPISTER
jgi:hypothetical protein